MSVSSGGGKGKSRGLEAELNLTSFIDLLSTIVCFLLVSSVWVQISSMDLKQSHGTDGGAASETAALDVDFQGPGKAFITLKKNGKVLQKASVSESTNASLVKKLNLTVISLKNLPALKNTKIESVLVGSHPLVNHGDMVSVLDGLRLHGFKNIGIKPNEGR